VEKRKAPSGEKKGPQKKENLKGENRDCPKWRIIEQIITRGSNGKSGATVSEYFGSNPLSCGEVKGFFVGGEGPTKQLCLQQKGHRPWFRKGSTPPWHSRGAWSKKGGSNRERVESESGVQERQHDGPGK